MVEVLDGGLANGELGVVMAPTGGGKSFFLVNLGYGALAAGKNVIHYSFELSETHVGNRYDSRITGIPTKELRNRMTEAENELETFLNKTGMPAACTLLGLSALDQTHTQYTGMLGMHGNYAPNKLTNEADLIFAVGMRFDDRVTGDLSRYAIKAKVVHLDIDPSEIDKNVPADVALIGDAKATLAEINKLVNKNTHNKWLESFNTLKSEEYKTVIDNDGVYRKTGQARIFISEADAIKAVKDTGPNKIKSGDIMVLMCGGPKGTGMQEVAQITIALKYLSYGKEVALITDGRFSGLSTGACIGHIGPEALDGGPIGKLLENDLIEIIIDTLNLEGSINLVGQNNQNFGVSWGNKELKKRDQRKDLKPQDGIPEDTILWAHLQSLSGGPWNGCVYDSESIRLKSQIK